jgi:hypothetical protein
LVSQKNQLPPKLPRSPGKLPKMEAEINILSLLEAVKRILLFLKVF